jgi:hypothetical protein
MTLDSAQDNDNHRAAIETLLVRPRLTGSQPLHEAYYLYLSYQYRGLPSLTARHVDVRGRRTSRRFVMT